MKAEIYITLKDGVLDPQGKAIQRSLENLNFLGVNDVRQGKLIELELEDSIDEKTANDRVESMCEKLLANTVIENYRFTIVK